MRESALDVLRATRTLALIAVVSCLSGVIDGLVVQSKGDVVLRWARDRAPEQVLEFLGAPVVVRDLPQVVDTAVALAFGIPVGFAVVMVLLWRWSRSAPLPALIVGLVVYVTTHVLAAVAEPMTLTRGMVGKAIVMVGLVLGIRAEVRRRSLV